MIGDIRVLIKGGGDLGTGVAWRLARAGFRVCITEAPYPTSIRREVSFSEAIYDGMKEVEGITAYRVSEVSEFRNVWERGGIPVIADPSGSTVKILNPEVVVDAIMAKRNTGTAINDAPVVIALGPGFRAGKDVHAVIETNRGHNLGRVILEGSAEENTGIPGNIGGYTVERVLRAPADGIFRSERKIGDHVKKGDVVGRVSGIDVVSEIDGVLRGLIRPGIRVRRGMKIGDVDPRGNREYCFTISDKSRAVAGGVLEAVMYLGRGAGILY